MPSNTTPTFAELGVPAPLVDALARSGRREAFAIQADSLPDSLAGRDVLGRAKTGSGKTLAFSIPLVAELSDAARTRRASRPTGLVLAPTRELANQIADEVRPLADAYGLRVTTIYGGVKQTRQVEALRGGVDIIVACPGRLEDLIQQGEVTLDGVRVTVLDEADHMADLGFLPSVTRLLKRTPANGQRLLFSATLDNGIDRLVKQFLHEPVLHSVDDPTSHVDAMTHHVFEVEGTEAKRRLVERLASGTGQRILFTRTKHAAKKLARQLTAAGIPAVDLHGNLSQNARDRNLEAFGSGKVHVLVATDVAARGVHVDHVELVVHVDPPVEHKAYLHRSGRTARAGDTGTVVTISSAAQRRDLAAVLRKAAIDAQPVQVTADSDVVAQVVGEVAPRVAPEPTPQSGAQQGRGQRSGQGASQGQGSRLSQGARQSQGSRQSQGRAARSGQGARQGQPSGQGQRSHQGSGSLRQGQASGQGQSRRRSRRPAGTR